MGRRNFLDRAHLRDQDGFTPPIHRYLPSPNLADWVRHYWIPVWNLPEGVCSRQRVLQYPICLLVVTPEYARLGGPARALSTTELRGRGWAFGVMLHPAAGRHLAGEVSLLVDGFRDLSQALLIDGSGLRDGLRAVMTAGPTHPSTHQAGIALTEATLARLPPAAETDRLVNDIVEWIEQNPEVLRVGQVCDRFGLGERALQRLCRQRVGLSPKWMIQRRRLHEAVAAIRDGLDLATLAADLGYADQAHLTRDFRCVTGMTPGQVRRQAHDAPAGDDPSGGADLTS